MSTESSLHSNALNFLSFMESGVDTRTGQYTLSIKLPELGANYFQGPDLELKLNFNPLNTVDSGWGKGWNLSLTQFTEHNQVLTTHTGETFKVTGSTGNRLDMKEQKLNHFHFYREPSGPGGNLRYRVVHRSGMVEILEMMGSQTGRIALPIEVYSPTGHKLILKYTPFNPAYMMLSSITDGHGQMLMEVERANGRIELRERPYQGDDGQPVARYVMNLINTSWVQSIVLPTPEQASWRFEYTEMLPHLCISKVETPTGAREYLLYQDGGHQFPSGSGRTPLPRVTRHIVEPGLGQPASTTVYSYPAMSNFLGYGIAVPWADDGLDNLYKHTGNYEYQTVETQCDANAKPLRSITRTFNRFHLLTSTRTVQNNSVHERFTTYDVRDASFDEQPSTLQLPIEERKRWSMADDVTRSRVETVKITYDTHGNETSRQLANGVTETSTWYSADAQDGYPGDANGFVRHLKSKTTTPADNAASGRKTAPTLTHHYRYKALPPLAGNDIELAHQVVEHSDRLVQQGNEAQALEETTYYYIDAPLAGLLHGRRYQEVLKRDKLETTTQYRFKMLVDPVSAHPVLETSNTVIGYDGTQRTTVQGRSLKLGETLYELDENGVQALYEYDVLRRATLERVSPGTAYEATRRYHYVLCASDGDIARQQVTSARGVTTETELDGLGRASIERRDNVHDARPGTFFEFKSIAYDALGNRVKETSTDWLQGSKMLTLVTNYQFDDWGEQCCTIGPDGVEVHDQLDPIGSPAHAGPIRRTWREGGQRRWRTHAVTRRGKSVRINQLARAISARTETWLNLFEKPVRERRLNALGELLAEREYSYDGLGRTLSETDEHHHTTTFTYDPFNRMLGTRQPNGTQLTRTYAAHSSEDLPASLVVTPANIQLPPREIGAQYHDGLNRLMGATRGNRTDYFLFIKGESRPRLHITPAGETIELDYNLQLTNDPISNNAPEDHASFEYHTTSARLTSSSNGQGRRRYDYNIANQLVAEHWDDQGSGKTWSRTHLSSLLDRVKSTTEANGIATTYYYDSRGRLESTRQGHLQAGYFHDDLSRLTRIISYDGASDQTLETEIEYDDQNHEIKRTWRQAGQVERTLEQVWDNDNLMHSRHLRAAGVSLLEEEFGYDTHARLVKHTCKGQELPQDPQGRSIASQVFSFDAYNNISLTLTTFAGGPRPERATFIHGESDPCQLQRIEYNPARPEPNPQFTYDANGNMTRDERGRPVRYDSQNRLLGFNPPGAPDTYGYDGNGLLVTALQAGKQTLLLHDGAQLRMAVRDGLETLYLHLDDQPLGIQQSGTGAQAPVLLHTSASHSVIAESQAGNLLGIRYAAYGDRHSDGPEHSPLGYNGEVLDPESGWYLLGNGYRAYNPALMRFHSPDSLSPFGEGGLNYYSYCQGNPVTFRDPTGHSSTGYTGYTGQSRSLEDLEVYLPYPSASIGFMFWMPLGVGLAMTAFSGASTLAFFLGGPVGKALSNTPPALKVVLIASSAASLALSVAGDIVSLEGVLTGNETTAAIGSILNIGAAIAGIPAMVVNSKLAIKNGLGAADIISDSFREVTKRVKESSFWKDPLDVLNIIPRAQLRA